MLEFSAFAASRPFQADALKDRSSMPPVSVTMQVLYSVAPAPVPPFSAGGSPHAAAAASAMPPTARTATPLIPRLVRKMISLPQSGRLVAVKLTDGSVRGSSVVQRNLVTVCLVP